MTSRTDDHRSGRARRRQGLTLIELVLVMALLTIVLGVAAPSLSRFFRGRNLDSEARRFLALTRYGQSRAATEGVPMVLWINAERGIYGLEADNTYTGNNAYTAANTSSGQNDTKAEEFTLAEKLQMEVELPVIQKTSGQWWQNLSTASGLANNNLMDSRRNSPQSNLPQIRFSPDGFIEETSPVRVLIREQQDNGAIWIAQSRNRLSYEIQTSIQQTARR